MRRGASALCGLGAILAAAPASAFCRAVTASPPAGYDPATQGCFNGEPGTGPVFPLFWRNQCVSYSLQNPATKKIAQSDVVRAASQAFSTWSAAACPGGMPSITAVAYPAVACNAVPSQEHNNVVIFRDDDWPYDDAANAIGFTTLTVDLSDGEIMGADIEINSANYEIVANGPATNGAYDLASILTHEAGHFLGLAHSESKSAVMYAFYQPGSTALAPDDVSGICATYTPEGLRNTNGGPMASLSCNAAPPMGFMTQCGSLDSGTGGAVATTVGSGGRVDAGADAADDPRAPCTAATCTIGRPLGDPALHPGAAALAVILCGIGVLRRRRTSFIR